MSHARVLTEAEMSSYRLDNVAFQCIEAHRRELQLPRSEFRILDWGCGRGLAVAWLRERGFDAFGVDVDAAPFRNGRDEMQRRGWNPDELLALIDGSGKSPFPDGHFHFVLSLQVLEHVADIDLVAREIERVTSLGGRGFHRYPAHRHLVEDHLGMPLIHWLPKNILRKSLILFWVVLGVEPRWPVGPGRPLRRKVNTYHAFSVNDTFYRSPRRIRAAFEARGFDVAFVRLDDARLHRSRGLNRLLTFAPARGIANWIQRHCGVVRLTLVKSKPQRHRGHGGQPQRRME